MTAQRSDYYKYKDGFSVIDKTGGMGFEPRDVGLKPHWISTNCLRGYWCEYDVSANGIILQRLFINTKDKKYPALYGVDVSEPEYESVDGYSYENGTDHKARFEILKNDGHHLYNNINHCLDCSGKILFGKAPSDAEWIQLGYACMWTYDEITELEFRNGELINEVEHTEMARCLRMEFSKIIANQHGKLSRKVIRAISDVIANDYPDQAWWLEPRPVLNW